MFDHDALRDVSSKAALEDVTTWADDELCVAVTTITAARRALDAAEAHVLAELDARGTTDREVGLPTATWLAHTTGTSRPTARARVRVATVLRRSLGETDDRLTRGLIPWERAKVMADVCNPRIEAGIAEVQGHLLDAGDGVQFEPWAREVAAFAATLDQDGGYDPDRDLTRNRLRLRRHGGGAELAGSFTPEHAVSVDGAVSQVADELFHRFARDHEADPSIEIPARPTLLALALAELCRRAMACDLDASAPARPEAVVVVHADDGPLEEAPVSTLDGVALPDGSLRALRCDADLRALVVDSLGVPLAMGRQVRLATPSQRRALAVRDGGCTFPGCDAPPSWCDAHHMPPWEDGGRTDVSAMTLLCRRHHGVVHRAGWGSGIDPDGWTWFTNANGLRLDGQRRGRVRSPGP